MSVIVLFEVTLKSGRMDSFAAKTDEILCFRCRLK